MSHAIGTPVYGANKKKNWRLKDGSNIYRILPPFGKLAEDGKWAIYEAIHWGYKGSKGARMFRCIEVRGKDKILKQECPECTLIEKRKAEYDRKFKQFTEVGGPENRVLSKDEAKEFLKPLSDWLFSHNKDNKWYLNALNTSSEIGRLAIPHKMFTALQQAISGPTGLISKKNIDPIRVDQGVFFDLQRSGKGNQTTHTVVPVTETFEKDGDTFERVKKAPLTEEVLKRMQGEASDLSNMFRTLTFDEIARLVTSGGDPNVVDSVFSTPEEQARNTAASTGSFSAMVEEEEPSADELVSAAVLPTSPPEVKPAEVDEIAVLKAKLAALESGKVTSAPTPTPVAKTAPTPAPAPKAGVAEMSNADFLANFAAGKL